MCLTVTKFLVFVSCLACISNPGFSQACVYQGALHGVFGAIPGTNPAPNDYGFVYIEPQNVNQQFTLPINGASNYFFTYLPTGTYAAPAIPAGGYYLGYESGNYPTGGNASLDSYSYQPNPFGYQFDPSNPTKQCVKVLPHPQNAIPAHDTSYLGIVFKFTDAATGQPVPDGLQVSLITTGSPYRTIATYPTENGVVNFYYDYNATYGSNVVYAFIPPGRYVVNVPAQTLANGANYGSGVTWTVNYNPSTALDSSYYVTNAYVEVNASLRRNN